MCARFASCCVCPRDLPCLQHHQRLRQNCRLPLLLHAAARIDPLLAQLVVLPPPNRSSTRQQRTRPSSMPALTKLQPTPPSSRRATTSCLRTWWSRRRRWARGGARACSRRPRGGCRAFPPCRHAVSPNGCVLSDCLANLSPPQLNKVSADAAEFKAGYDKLAVDAVEQKAQVGVLSLAWPAKQAAARAAPLCSLGLLSAMAASRTRSLAGPMFNKGFTRRFQNKTTNPQTTGRQADRRRGRVQGRL